MRGGKAGKITGEGNTKKDKRKAVIIIEKITVTSLSEACTWID